MMHLARLKRSRKVEDIIQRLWRETVSSDYMKAGGTWTLEHYMDYHLSLFVYFETRYGGEEGEITEMEARAAMVDAAWESALEDYYGDIKAAKVEAAKTGGDPKLDFNTFSASVFELTSLYADSRSEEDFCEFLKELIEETTVPALGAGRSSSGSASKPKPALSTLLNKAVADTQRPAATKLRNLVKRTGQRTWRHRYPREVYRKELDNSMIALRTALLGERYCKEVPTTLDAVKRKKLQREAADRLTAWVNEHSAKNVKAAQTCIGTPTDLLLALINTSDNSNKASMRDAMEDALSWISSEIDHEISVEDDAARGRLIALFRALDADQDGRISASDLHAVVRIAEADK